MQVTETCDEEGLLAIVNVETTVATEQDFSAVEPVHAHLARKQLLPAEHFIDSAYIAADILVSSEDNYGVELVGPIRPNRSWQAEDEAAYAIARFEIDWEREMATCPQGKRSRYWKPAKRLKNRTSPSSTILPMVQVHFHEKDCAACSARSLCTRKAKGPRELTLPVQKHYEAMIAARARQETDVFWERYAVRSGVEGAVSQGTRLCGLRRSRYRGLAKTHLQHVATAAAINLKRAVDWLNGVPRSRSYQSPFSLLAVA